MSLGVVSRQEIKGAIAKAIELRALHLALYNSRNSRIRKSPSSAFLLFVSLHFPPFLRGQDYPIFTPLDLTNMVTFDFILEPIVPTWLDPGRVKKVKEFIGVKAWPHHRRQFFPSLNGVNCPSTRRLAHIAYQFLHC
ncbi:hypothetical protein HAX54_037699 [Datura stramonium]|uniref:Uncharacterized protein n=1 Tax=Datura stramonium TaxID=4076 RepID=A0ABS8VIM7_DATST|nr:hypothetical protein [Datura stramonium]